MTARGTSNALALDEPDALNEVTLEEPAMLAFQRRALKGIDQEIDH